MNTLTLAAALLAGSALAAPAHAAEPDLAAELQAMRAELQSLRAEVAALKGASAPVPQGSGQVPNGSLAVPYASPAPTPAANSAPSDKINWKGAPQFSGKDGFSFKPKGFLQFDAGFVGTPGPERAGTVGGLNYNNLGWNTRARRAVFGAEGTLPGGFAYKAEFNFAQGSVDYEDLTLSYQRKGSPIQVTVGNFYPLSSLETMTSSRLTSFLERASLTDAFGYNRRLGAAVALLDAEDVYTLTAGIFSQEINNASFNRTGWQASVRGTYAPEIGDTRLHLGANFQHRVAQRDDRNVRYRNRPLTQLTDQRFTDTGAIAADGDDIAGVELAAINGPFHFAAEAQQVWVRGYRAGRTFGPNDGVGSGIFYAGDPSFRSAYAEAGFYITGESRGYKRGRWDGTKVAKPFDKGGWGALQLNLRLDYVDLADRVANGASILAPAYVNGGTQLGYQSSLIWHPTDYLRFAAQYARAAYEGGPRAATVLPGSTAPVTERDFNVDSFAVRAQVEF